MSDDKQYLLLSGGRDGSLCLWQFTEGGGLVSKQEKAHDDWMWSVTQYDENTVVTSSADKLVKTWEIYPELKEKTTMKGHTDVVFAVCPFPEADTIVSGGYDQTIRIWDADSGECKESLEEHEGTIRDICKVGNDCFASASADKTIKVWNLEKLKRVNLFKKNNGMVVKVDFDEKNNLLYSCSSNTVKVYDTQKKKGGVSSVTQDDWIKAVHVFQDTTWFVTGDFIGWVYLWDTRLLKRPLRKEYKHTRGISRIVGLPDEGFATCSDDHTIKTWKLRSGKRMFQMQEKSEVYDIGLVVESSDREREILPEKDEDGLDVPTFPMPGKILDKVDKAGGVTVVKKTEKKREKDAPKPKKKKDKKKKKKKKVESDSDDSDPSDEDSDPSDESSGESSDEEQERKKKKKKGKKAKAKAKPEKSAPKPPKADGTMSGEYQKMLHAKDKEISRLKIEVAKKDAKITRLEGEVKRMNTAMKGMEMAMARGQRKKK